MKQERLKQSIKILQAFLLRHKAFALILLAQALVLLYFIARLFAPKGWAEVSLEAVASAASVENTSTQSVVYQAETGLQIANAAEDTTPLLLTAPALSLAPGAYTLTVSYQSDSEATALTNDVNAYNIGVYTETTQSPLPLVEYGLQLLLRDSMQQLEGRVWSPLQSSQTVVTLYYTGTGACQISSIVLEEQLAFRLVLLFGVAGLFVLCDFFLCYLWQLVRYLRQAKPRQASATFARQTRWLLLLGMAALASVPFLAEGFYDIDDAHFHVARIANVAAELANGQFPVRMMTEMMNGYSYPNSLYYCDIFLYFPALLYNCMVPLQLAYKIYVVCINLATAGLAYWCFDKMVQQKGTALTGAMLYTLAAYRLVNLHQRAAVGEYTAMVFLPLIILGLWQIYQTQKPTWRSWLPLSLGMAGVIQSHVLSVQIVVAFLLLFCLLCARQTFVFARIKSLVFAALLCTGLTAWFWLPFVQSFLTIEINAFDRSYNSISTTAVTLVRVFSLQGYVAQDHYIRGYLGWALVAGALLSLAYLCYMVIKKPKDATLYTQRAMVPLLLLGGFATLLASTLFPWETVLNTLPTALAELASFIQFPWRYFTIATICFVTASVLALALLYSKSQRGYRAAVAVLTVLSVLSTGLFYHTVVGAIEEPNVKWNTLEWMDTMRSGNGEYFLSGIGYTDAYETVVAVSDESLIVASYQKIDGIAYVSLENTGDAVQTVTLPIWNYPNYQATDAAGAQYTITTGEGSQVAISIPAGYQGMIQVEYASPWYWHVAELITLLSWGGIGAAWLVQHDVIGTKKKKVLV